MNSHLKRETFVQTAGSPQLSNSKLNGITFVHEPLRTVVPLRSASSPSDDTVAPHHLCALVCDSALSSDTSPSTPTAILLLSMLDSMHGVKKVWSSNSRAFWEYILRNFIVVACPYCPSLMYCSIGTNPLFALRDVPSPRPDGHELCLKNYQIEIHETKNYEVEYKYKFPYPYELGFRHVFSAFGGAALYKTEYIDIDCKYNFYEDYKEPTNEIIRFAICEHVPFNLHLCKQGPLFINTKWIVGER